MENTQQLIWTTNRKNNEVPVLNEYKYSIKRKYNDDKIDVGWEIFLSMISNEDDNVADFFQYVYQTWVSETSIFLRILWCREFNTEARTNNALEGSHSKLNRKVNKTHPNPYELLANLIEVQHQNEMELSRLLSGGPLKKKYLDSETTLFNLRNLYCKGLISLEKLLDVSTKAVKLD